MLQTGIGFNKYAYDISDGDYFILLRNVGIDRFRHMVEYSAECGVKACFENGEFRSLSKKAF